jgi:hypothetical protein
MGRYQYWESIDRKWGTPTDRTLSGLGLPYNYPWHSSQGERDEAHNTPEHLLTSCVICFPNGNPLAPVDDPVNVEQFVAPCNIGFNEGMLYKRYQIPPEGKFICMECGELDSLLNPSDGEPPFPVDGGTGYCGGYYVHDGCAPICNSCGQLYYYMVNADEAQEGYCNLCFEGLSRCSLCDRVTDDSNLVQIEDDCVCEECIVEHFWYCDNCAEYHRSGRDNDCPNGPDIEDYSYKPRPVFYLGGGNMEIGLRGVLACGLPSDTVFMGMELEMEFREAPRHEVCDTLKDGFGDLIYLKHDGSLMDGVEMVTHPMTLEYIHETDWSPIDRVRRMGARSWDTDSCGIHVHVGRNTFVKDSHAWRFATMITNNPGPFQRFAGRSGTHYAEWDGQYHEVSQILVKKQRPYERYVVVNLENTTTIELRFFRGSLRVERVLANLEMIHACVQYTRNLTYTEVAHGATGFGVFASWVMDNAAVYPALAKKIYKKDNVLTEGGE